ncbi:MAG: hypothetical protein R2787_16905 [Saprospiraceae bacterium]
MCWRSCSLPAGEKNLCRRQPPPKIYNPNGDSELALLMRDMFDEGMRVRK